MTTLTKTMESSHAQELQRGERFAFGENWKNFLGTLDDERIEIATQSLRDMLGVESLEGKRFLDAGSGSGLFSLAARRLGATVHSFDFDPQSVACTTELRRRYFANDPSWTIQEGSVLDPAFLAGLGEFDIVYSWGVLHHTGQMWSAIDNVQKRCKAGGTLFISIYNNMGSKSKIWTAIKKTYCRLPAPLKVPFAISVVTPLQIRSLMIYTAAGRPIWWLRDKINYRSQRGMSWWHDQIDWIGGYPYEDARPEEIFRFLQERGFSLHNLTTCGGGIGCNQFVFKKQA
jgi:2-polyprenyl-3-methyl-5-hydroxy-6-metoxy-1,4-benzoquinol methylase